MSIEDPKLNSPNSPKREELKPMTDMEIVLSISTHIAEPCKDAKGNDIRQFYLTEAKRYLKENIVTDPNARETLEKIIKIYSR